MIFDISPYPQCASISYYNDNYIKGDQSKFMISTEETENNRASGSHEEYCADTDQ